MAVAGGIGAPPPQQQPSADGGDGGTTPLLPSPAMSPAVIKPPATPLQRLVLMPATAEHNLARLRWHSAAPVQWELHLAHIILRGPAKGDERPADGRCQYRE